MKIKHLCSFAALFTVLLSSCSKNNTQAVTVTTGDATNITTQSITFSGEIANDATNAVIRGVCFSQNNNPVRGQDSYVDADGSGNGTFTVTAGLNSNFQPGSTGHYRAYAVLSGTTVYGSDKTFTVAAPLSVTTGTPYDITTNIAYLKGTYNVAQPNTATVGFVYSTTPGPTAGGGGTVVQYTSSVSNSGSYNVTIGGLQPSTTYYVRAYTGYNGGYIYGAEQSFKTAGYLGTGGGYVVYDKGDTTGGWRFLEAAPEDIFDANNNLYSWGCEGTAIGQTSIATGNGPANTAHIVTGCTAAECAARGCNNYVSPTGVSDWFLGSRDEMRFVYMSLESLNAVVANGKYWTSSELTQSTASYVFPGLATDVVAYGSYAKGNSLNTRPIRRF